MAQKLSVKGLAWSLAIVSALCMVLIWIGGVSGIYTGAYEMMQGWHIFFNLTFVGLIGGIIEAGIWSFIGGWLIALFYNKFA